MSTRHAPCLALLGLLALAFMAPLPAQGAAPAKKPSPFASPASNASSVGVTSASSLAISTTMEKVAYDPQKDLAPIKLVAEVPEAFFKAGTMA